jgi:alpha-glucosidase (family GH31 glycosyl hydrolase)
LKKLTYGVPEDLTPSVFCRNFQYNEKTICFDTSKVEFTTNKRGCVLTFPLSSDEQLYGFGLQLKSFNHKNKKLTLRVNADPVAPTGDSHAPVPFFVSTAGYGIYVDTARYAEFYCGIELANGSAAKAAGANQIGTSTEDLYSARADNGNLQMAIQIPVAQGIDIYIIEGETITDIVSQYNMLSGGGCEVPSWGLEVFYRCYTKYTGEQVMAMADYFRDTDIPCTILGLEPGWQTHAYSCSYVWDEERYGNHEQVIDYLGQKGFHINLWEHAFTHPSSPIYAEIGKGCGNYKVWDGYVPDFALPETRKVFSDYHKKELIKGSVDGFKLDECDSSDYTGGWSFPNLSEFPSRLDGEQYHSLFGTLYMQTMLEALAGKPTLSEVRCAGALAASYPFVLYSDLYDHKDFIRGAANAGFSGILWTPEVRDAQSKEDLLRRLQTVVFSTQCLINAWYCEKAPWIELDCEDEVREILKLRQALVPMLQAAFNEYHKSGKPPVRALVSDYTSDKETFAIDDQYIFCGNLIVAPMTAGQKSRKVYLPQGNWQDYFTKQPARCGWFEIETSQIPVFEKC